MSPVEIHPGAPNSPLPDDIDDAWDEILALRSILIREREVHVALVERYELARRSMRTMCLKLEQALKG
jgi:hypothetical protein